MSQTIYEHKNQGKTLVSLMFLITAIAAVVLGSSFGASIYWYIPIGFALLAAAWWFMNNPNHGCELTSETLELWSGKNTETVAISDIASVSIKEWTDGPDDVSLVMKDGSSREVSHLQFGNSGEFRKALELIGISFIVSNE